MQTAQNKYNIESILRIPYKEIRKLAAKGEPDTEFITKCDNIIDAYASPPGYLEWNNYAKLCLLNGSTEATKRSYMANDVRGVVAGTSYRRAVLNNVCARFLSKDIIESFVQTALPELPLEIADIFPYVHLILPRNTVYDCEGDEVIAMMIESGKLYDSSLSEEQKYIAKVFFPKERIAPPDLCNAEGLQILTITANGIDVFQEFVLPRAKNWHELNVRRAGDSKYQNKATQAILRIAINSLLVHLYEPSLVTVDPKTPSRGIGFSSTQKQPLPPTWIGKTFTKTVANRTSEKDAGEDAPSRGNVRSHWRRGHWHSVCIGPGRLQRKVQWFKPVYVNSHLAGA